MPAIAKYSLLCFLIMSVAGCAIGSPKISESKFNEIQKEYRPRVIVDTGLLTKTVLWNDEELSSPFHTISYIDFVPSNPGKEILAISMQKAVVVDVTGNLLHAINFETKSWYNKFYLPPNVKPIDSNSDGVYEFYATLENMAMLLDNDGELLWWSKGLLPKRYREYVVNPVDIDGDGSMEFLVEDRKLFVLFDSDGRILIDSRKFNKKRSSDWGDGHDWRNFTKYPLDLDGDGADEILGIYRPDEFSFPGDLPNYDMPNSLFVLNDHLEILDRLTVEGLPEDSFFQPMTILSSDIPKREHFVYGYLVDEEFRGHAVIPLKKLNFRNFVRIGNTKTKQEPSVLPGIRFRNDLSLAFVRSDMFFYQGVKAFGAEMSTDAISIRTLDKGLIYHEYLDRNPSSFAIIPGAENGAENLLVGGSNIIILYHAKTL